MTSPIKTNLARGQSYVDKPVFVEVSRAKPLALAINSLRPIDFNPHTKTKKPADVPVVLPFIDEMSHYERTPLRWMKPDGKGGLTPCNTK